MKKYLLLFVLVFILASGGCGSDTHNNFADTAQDNSQQEQYDDDDDETLAVSVELDADGDGVPDIFSSNPEGYSNGRNAPSNGLDYEVPYLNYIDSSDVDENGLFTTKIYLEQGREYTIKYSHSGRLLGDSDMEFRILTPESKDIVFDFGFAEEIEAPSATEQEASEGDEDTTSTEPETITVRAEVEVLPEENPCMIFYTFTAPETGSYTFMMKEVEYAPTEHDVPYELRVYYAGDDTATTLGDITMTPRDAIFLQRLLLHYADSFNEDGLPTSFSQEFYDEEIYENIIKSIAARNGVNASAIDPKMPKKINDIPFAGNEPALGSGIFADTGEAANEMVFYDPYRVFPKAGSAVSYRVNFVVRELATVEEIAEALGYSTMSTVPVAKNFIQSLSFFFTNGYGFGSLTRNILVSYEYVEPTPRVMNFRKAELEDGVTDILEEDGADAFGKMFGDYFVAGYTFGQRIIISIAISADDNATLDKASELIQDIMRKAKDNQDYSASNSALKAIEDNKLDMSISVRTNGCTLDFFDSTRPEDSFVAGLARSLAKFVQSEHDTEKFEPIKFSLYQYSLIPELKDRLSSASMRAADDSEFTDLMTKTKELFVKAVGYNFSLLAIPEDHLKNPGTLRASWENDMNSLTYEAISGDVFRDEATAKDFTDRLEKKCNEFQAMYERYVFYRRLVEAQSTQPRSFGDNGNDTGSISAGFRTYPQSSYVMSDYGKYAYTLWHNWRFVRGVPVGKTTANFRERMRNDWRYVWLETGWRDTVGSTGTDANYPTIGSKHVDWQYEGGVFRSVDWYFRDAVIYMPESKYPFVGLSD